MRADGKRVKHLKPFFEIIPYIMNKRVDSQNYITQEVDIDGIREYINQNRGSGAGISHLSIVIAAFFKTAREYEQLNYFVVNKKIYRRNHFCISFVALKNDGGDEVTEQTVVKIFLEDGDNIFTISKKVNDAVEANKDIKESNATDKLLSRLMHFPGLATFSVGLIKVLDRFGLLPRTVIDASPFHTSLFITNMASLRSKPIYHHIYEFGTTSIFVALGQNEKRLTLQKDGSVAEKTIMPLGIVTDERIASGHYYTSAFRKMEKYLKDPKLLEEGTYYKEEANEQAVQMPGNAQAQATCESEISDVAEDGAETQAPGSREDGAAGEKSFASDLKLAYKIALTRFRGSTIIVRSLRGVWFDRALQRGIERIESAYLPYLLTIIGLMVIGLTGAGRIENSLLFMLMGAWIVFALIIMVPLIFYAVLPKPIANHMKRIDSLSEEERKLYEEDLDRNKRVNKIIKRYTMVDRRKER